MKLSDDIKTEIRCFVYFLFKGTIDPRLINTNYDYLELLLKNPELVFNCFKLFVSGYSSGVHKPHTLVSNYIISIHSNSAEAEAILNTIEEKLPVNEDNFWFSFIEFARRFCFNTLPVTLKNFDLYEDLFHCGTDALTPFIIWTNVVEIDENNHLLNKEYATRRANEILLSVFDGLKPDIPFSEEELDAEFY